MSAIQLLQITPKELAILIKEGIKPDLEQLIKQHLADSSGDKEFLSRQETAHFLNISLPCLHDWVKKGIITPYKLGNRTYFNKAKLVETLLSSNNHE